VLIHADPIGMECHVWTPPEMLGHHPDLARLLSPSAAWAWTTSWFLQSEAELCLSHSLAYDPRGAPFRVIITAKGECSGIGISFCTRLVMFGR